MSARVSILRELFLEREIVASLRLRQAIALSALVLLTALGAWVVVFLPGNPVPFTLQTFFVLAGAGLLGSRLSSAAQGSYLLLGGVGLPLYAGGTFGAPALLGATGGYLVGFVLASWFIGRQLASPGRRSWPFLLLILALGDLLILACGTLWLGASLHLAPARALALGTLPFLPGDIVKLVAAAALIQTAGPRLRKLVHA